MMITCNGELQGLTVAGEFGNTMVHPELQIWRPTSTGNIIFNRETTLTYRFPVGCSSASNSVQQCSFSALRVEVGDIIAILLPSIKSGKAGFQIYFTGMFTPYSELSISSMSFSVPSSQLGAQPLIYLDIVPG